MNTAVPKLCWMEISMFLNQQHYPTFKKEIYVTCTVHKRTVTGCQGWIFTAFRLQAMLQFVSSIQQQEIARGISNSLRIRRRGFWLPLYPPGNVLGSTICNEALHILCICLKKLYWSMPQWQQYLFLFHIDEVISYERCQQGIILHSRMVSWTPTSSLISDVFHF